MYFLVCSLRMKMPDQGPCPPPLAAAAVPVKPVSVTVYQIAFPISCCPRKPRPLTFTCVSAGASLTAGSLMCKNRCKLMLLS